MEGNGVAVLQGGVPDAQGTETAENTTEPSQLSDAYVHSLASLGLERLQNEPGRLQAEAAAVDEALHSLSLDHYRVFIQNQECVRHVNSQGKEMDGHLSALLAEVQGLGSEFSVFQREAAELVGGHKRNRQTLKHHMQLVELLEIPQLMDACVRSDLMEEALSIATFASTLERRHRSRRPPSRVAPSFSGGSGTSEASSKSDEQKGRLPGVMKMIVDEVRESARGLHERLLAKLRGPIQLTTCLQIVSCLRRLELLSLEEKSLKRQQQRRRQQQGAGVEEGQRSSEAGAARGRGPSEHRLALVEMKLQVDFLEARDAWLAESASRAGVSGDLQQALGLSSSSPYQSLMDLVETNRSQWFEVATQFKAIFMSDGAGAAEGTGGLGRRRSGGSIGGIDSVGGAGSDVLSLWLLRKVTGFVGQLKAVLPLVEDGASLRGLLEECMFFGASMGRLGADFRGLLVPVFEERVLGAARGQWASATTDFVVTLRDIAAIEAAGDSGASLLHVPEKASGTSSTWAASDSRGDGVDPTGGGAAGGTDAFLGEEGPPSPPRSLMAFPPVARLVNLFLTSFNQLRECLPISVEARLTEELVACFTDAFRGLADLKKATVRVSAATETAASSTAAAASGSRMRGSGSTARAVELCCEAMALQAVPYTSVCFAFLFGEKRAPKVAKTTGVPTNPAAVSASGAGEGRAARLSSRLVGTMEKFGIRDKVSPPAPTDKVPRVPAPREAFGSRRTPSTAGGVQVSKTSLGLDAGEPRPAPASPSLSPAAAAGSIGTTAGRDSGSAVAVGSSEASAGEPGVAFEQDSRHSRMPEEM